MYFLRPLSHWPSPSAESSITRHPPYFLSYPWCPSLARQQIDYSEVHRSGADLRAFQLKRAKTQWLEAGNQKTVCAPVKNRLKSLSTALGEQKRIPARNEGLGVVYPEGVSVNVAYTVRRKLRCKPIPPWRWYEDRNGCSNEGSSARTSNPASDHVPNAAQTPVSHNHRKTLTRNNGRMCQIDGAGHFAYWRV